MRGLARDWKEGNHSPAFVVLNNDLDTSRTGLPSRFLSTVVFARPEIVIGNDETFEGLIISAFVVAIGEGLEHHGGDVVGHVIGMKSSSSISGSHQPVVLLG